VPFGTPTIPATGRFLLVNQDEQKMHVYENGVEIRTIPVSTGAPVANAFTPPWRGAVGDYWGGGPFRDNNYWADYMWYLFPGEEGSILIHSVPYLRSGDMKIYDRPDALGVRPASHGCVRISPEEAEWLKAWNPVGVPIEITPWSGEIGPPDTSYGQ
jgi:lipoprotein-anchoring transpeptidase ErfK/SrfK